MLDTLDVLWITIWFFVIATPSTPWLLRLHFHLMRHGARKPFTKGVLRCPVQQRVVDIWSANEQGGCYQGCMLPKQWLFFANSCASFSQATQTCLVGLCTPHWIWANTVTWSEFFNLRLAQGGESWMFVATMHRILLLSWCKFEGLAKHRRNLRAHSGFQWNIHYKPDHIVS